VHDDVVFQDAFITILSEWLPLMRCWQRPVQ